MLRLWPTTIPRTFCKTQLRMSTQASYSQVASSHKPPVPGPYTAENYVRQADHTPNTNQEGETVYILTLHTDPAHHKHITALRTQYFPPKLNKLSAHVALFRALPGSHLPTIETDIATICTHHRPFPINTTTPFLLNHGVGINVAAPPAKEIYAQLKEKWVGFLSQQDKSFRPHYTIQNKAEEGVPERTMEEVGRGFKGSRGEVRGLSLWRYERGHWRFVRDFMFPERGGDVNGFAGTGT